MRYTNDPNFLRKNQEGVYPDPCARKYRFGLLLYLLQDFIMICYLLFRVTSKKEYGMLPKKILFYLIDFRVTY